MDEIKKIKLPLSPQMRQEITERFQNKQPVKRPHNVAEFTLRRFVGIDGKVCVFDKVDLETFKASPKDITVVKGFFDSEWADSHFDEPDLPSQGQLVEELFWEIENANAPIIEGVIDRVRKGNTGALTRDERWEITGYVATQYVRTVEFREYMSENHAAIRLEQLKAQHPEIDTTDVRLEIADKAAYHFQLIGRETIQMLHKILIEEHECCLHITNASNPFWISDQAALASKGGFLRPGNFYAMPLSPDILIAFYRHNENPPSGLKKGISTRCKKEAVSFLNSLQVKRSYRQVYANENNFEEAIRLCKLIPELRNPKRPRIRVTEAKITDNVDRVGFHLIDY